MNIGDLVRDITIQAVGLIVEIGSDDRTNEPYAVVRLLDGTDVLVFYEHLELVACSKIKSHQTSENK